jgi:hypothetical protein
MFSTGVEIFGCAVNLYSEIPRGPWRTHTLARRFCFKDRSKVLAGLKLFTSARMANMGIIVSSTEEKNG